MIKGTRVSFINVSRDLGTETISTIEKERLGDRKSAGNQPKAGSFSALRARLFCFVRARLCWEEEYLLI